MADRLSELMLEMESESPLARREIEMRYRDIVDAIVASLVRAREMSDASLYMELENTLGSVDADLRESVQAVTRKAMWKIIVKLRGSDEISEQELELIRIWVVGEADAYVHAENNYGDWLEEFDRLKGKIERLREAPVEVEGMEKLRGLLTDARGVARSVANFLNYRERAEHFEQTVSRGLDAVDRSTLADILARSYNSRSV